METEDLPLLGETLAVEFANTRYGVGPESIDFLGSAARAALWFGAGPWAQDARDLDWPPAAHRRLLGLRDAVHGLCAAQVAGARPAADDLATVNAAVHGAPRAVTLWWERGAYQRHEVRRGDPYAQLFAQVADDAVALFGSARREKVRRCPGPGCTMFYEQTHHRRGFCHPSCSHRARQARYYRRKKAEEAGAA